MEAEVGGARDEVCGRVGIAVAGVVGTPDAGTGAYETRLWYTGDAGRR